MVKTLIYLKENGLTDLGELEKACEATVLMGAWWLPPPIFVTGMKISILNEAGSIQDDISVFAHKSANVN